MQQDPATQSQPYSPPETSHLESPSNIFRPWSRLAIVLAVATFLVLGSLQISRMDAVFFQPSLSGFKGLVFYLAGDDLTAAKAYRQHFREVVGARTNADGSFAYTILSDEREELEKEVKHALDSGSYNPSALLVLSAIALEEGRPKEASLILARLLQANPDYGPGLVFSAITNARIGDYEKAISTLNRTLRNNQIALDQLSFILLLETAGELDQSPTDEKPWCLLAHIYRYLRIIDPSNGDRAIRYAKEAVKADDFPAQAYLTMAVVYRKQGKLAQALETALQSTEIEKDFADGYWQAGYLYGRMGDLANNFLMNKAAFEVDPGDPFFVGNLGFSMMEKLGDAQQTVVLFERAVQVNPQNWPAYHWLGRAYAFLGKHDQAVNRLHLALDAISQNDGTYRGEGYSLDRMVSIHRDLASSLQELDRPEEAIETLQQAIKLEPYDVGPHIDLVYLYRELNRYKEAVQEINASLEYGNLNIGVLSGLCSVYYEAFETQAAADCFHKVLARDPKDMRARRLLPEVLNTLRNQDIEL